MGNQLVWQDRFNIGVESIDREHKKLFSILNKMLRYRDQPDKMEWVCREGIKYFKDHAMRHFTDEEAYMASIGYEGFEMHRKVHDNFRKNTLPALERELDQTSYSADAINHFLGVCAGWLVGHILTEDSAITGETISKWTDLMPEEEQAAMCDTIIELIYDLFRLKARVISEYYRGEKFGKGIYYRLVYAANEKEKWEFILIFEEKLIVNTIGNILGEDSEQINVMLVNAARYTAQQFVRRIREHDPSVAQGEVERENLLTYEQFEKVFEKHRPQTSLLFDTGAGYFAYCVIAPHLLQNEGETSIRADNAVGEIKKYLKKNQTANKRKILVVDDSRIILQAMQELLQKDYDVAVASSAASAIQCITLNRPDLILLDYEMPICNGAQVLEMIRAEEGFANIPVIFLSGMALDKDYVGKILALKPAGYMIKNQKTEEIKKGVDDFFRKKGK